MARTSTTFWVVWRYRGGFIPVTIRYVSGNIMGDSRSDTGPTVYGLTSRIRCHLHAVPSFCLETLLFTFTTYYTAIRSFSWIFLNHVHIHTPRRDPCLIDHSSPSDDHSPRSKTGFLRFSRRKWPLISPESSLFISIPIWAHPCAANSDLDFMLSAYEGESSSSRERWLDERDTFLEGGIARGVSPTTSRHTEEMAHTRS